VPSGTTLTTVNGTLTTSSNGQVIDAKLITGDLVIANDNVTVTRSRIKGRIVNNRDYTSTANTVFQDSDIGRDDCSGGSSPFTTLVGSDYRLTRTHVHNGGADLLGLHGGGTILVQDSLIDGACFYTGDHLDAAQFYDPGGIGDVTFFHDSLDARCVNSCGDKGNAAIFWADAPGAGSRLTVTNTLLAGGNWSISPYDAGAGSKIIITISSDTFVKNSYKYSPCRLANSIPFNGIEGVKFTGNKLDDGTSVATCDG
jgi:hypothetical protein